MYFFLPSFRVLFYFILLWKENIINMWNISGNYLLSIKQTLYVFLPTIRDFFILYFTILKDIQKICVKYYLENCWLYFFYQYHSCFILSYHLYHETNMIKKFSFYVPLPTIRVILFYFHFYFSSTLLWPPLGGPNSSFTTTHWSNWQLSLLRNL